LSPTSDPYPRNTRLPKTGADAADLAEVEGTAASARRFASTAAGRLTSATSPAPAIAGPGDEPEVRGSRAGGIGVVAPSGPIPEDRLAQGLSVLARELAEPIWLAPNLSLRDGYFAGDDAARLAGLVAALQRGVDTLWVARGGYGLTRILGRIDPALMRSSRPTIVGFSDATALLCWAWALTELPGIHGPVVTQLGELGPDDLDRVFSWQRGEVPSPLQADAGTVCRGGTVEGPLIVGNVEVLRSLIGTPWMPSLDGCLLAIEEIGERPYRIDRALTQLLASGSLRGLRGVVVGQLHACREPEHGGSHGMSADEVVVERLEALGVPLVTGFPFGHAPTENAALPFGARVRLHADDATLEFLEPVRTRPSAATG
jgi:muramoyltetrapeptide carboxypeptidase